MIILLTSHQFIYDYKQFSLNEIDAWIGRAEPNTTHFSESFFRFRVACAYSPTEEKPAILPFLKFIKAAKWYCNNYIFSVRI
ncbi:hypothetical protein DPMN_062337 [Dreissena polymorpha]|uniref:Uncharacterized protein n=1 Tax=Dreissena polymorpha TaxID=45954 RepID=A0A9D4C937_DREPO|nr:hypothetical protein DPMN_062337 [Dreissena polymorpha]